MVHGKRSFGSLPPARAADRQGVQGLFRRPHECKNIQPFQLECFSCAECGRWPCVGAYDINGEWVSVCFAISTLECRAPLWCSFWLSSVSHPVICPTFPSQVEEDRHCCRPKIKGRPSAAHGPTPKILKNAAEAEAILALEGAVDNFGSKSLDLNHTISVAKWHGQSVQKIRNNATTNGVLPYGYGVYGTPRGRIQFVDNGEEVNVMKFIFTSGREGIPSDGPHNLSIKDTETLKEWFKEHVPLYRDLRIHDYLSERGEVEIEVDLEKGVAGAFLPKREGDASDEDDRHASRKWMPSDMQKRRAAKKSDGCVIIKMEPDDADVEAGYTGVMVPRKHPLFLSTLLTLYFPSLCALWAPENRRQWLEEACGADPTAVDDPTRLVEGLSDSDEDGVNAGMYRGGVPDPPGSTAGLPRSHDGAPAASSSRGISLSLRAFALNVLLRGGPETEMDASRETRFRRGWRGTQKVIALLASVLEDEWFEFEKFGRQKKKKKMGEALGGEAEAEEKRKATYIPDRFPGGIQDYKQSYIDAMTYTARNGKPRFFYTWTNNYADW